MFASLSLNVYLGWKVKRGNVPSNLPVPVAPGTKVEPIKAASLDGEPQTISYHDTDKPTVLYVLSPTCPWCDRNRANIAKLTERGDRFRFVGLSLSEAGLKEYVDKQQLKFPVYTRVTPEAQIELGLGPTPQTIVISPEGRVLKNWAGAYNEQTRDEIEEYFQIQLPGLVSN
ncbi:MAG TPA: redoxin family protein [Pyrinomonadaceae bacterium]